MQPEILDAFGAAEKIMEQIERKMEELKTLNLMILGKTGVGKSTLINALFGETRVKTGLGRPVTTDIERIPGENLTIYDTPGLELGGDNSMSHLLSQVVEVINKQVEEGTIDDAIHCILYCVSTPSHRFEDNEADFIKSLQVKIKTHNIPIFIVLTQSFNKNDSAALKTYIASLNLKIKAIVPVLATSYYVDEDYTAKPRGLAELAQLISEAIPESVKDTFAAIQCANLDLKKQKARAVIAGAAAGAAAIGAAPIPFSDAALLVPEQITMLASITAVFGIPIDKAALAAILSATIGTGGLTLLGKTIVTNLIKLIPGAGSIVGGAISAATAAALTSGLGEAYIVIMTMVNKGEVSPEFIKTQEGINEITKIFVEKMKLARNSDGSPKVEE
ncbi:MAG: 50S ribosome-binding GTPase [Clostridia bacterium]|nr:50S ribosome-binding GTPase [Clostridia bacterium]